MGSKKGKGGRVKEPPLSIDEPGSLRAVFEAIMNGMREGLILADKTGQVIAVNQAAYRFVGLEPDAGGFSFVSSVGRSAFSFILKQFAEDLKEGRAIEKDVELSHPRRQVIRISTSPISDHENGVFGSSILLTDVTRDREIEQMKSDFVSAVSHELRTPLTSIREAISLIVDELAGPVTDKQKRCLEIAIRNADRLGRLINNVLNLSKIESGKVLPKRMSVDVAHVVEGVVESLGWQAETNGLRLDVDLPKSIPCIFADADQITQVLINLLGNAIKFTHKGGMIKISIGLNSKEEGKGQVRISVADTGVGISKDEQAKLFTKFGQLDTGLKRKPGGTGLGLAISREIVHMHGGRIWVESEPGQGSVFSFTIPIFTDDSVYLDLIQEEIERVRDVQSDLLLILLAPRVDADVGGCLQDVKVVEDAARSVLRSGNDFVFRYRNRFVIVVAEVGHNGIEKIISRIKAASRQDFRYVTANFPSDGERAEELIGKLMS